MAELVQFDVPSGRRIANAVRAIEGIVPPGRPLTYSPILWRESRGRGGQVQLCTYSGAWATDASKTVTLRGQTTTPNTLSVTNLFLPLPDAGPRACAVAKSGTAWYLLQVQWNDSNVLSNATLTAEALQFSRVQSVSLGTAATVSISITTCTT